MKYTQKESHGSTKQIGILPVFLAAMVLLVLGVGCDSNSNSSSRGKAQAAVAFDDAEIRIEINATDGDAGFQIFLDGEGWETISVTDPNGQEIFASEAIDGGGVLGIGGGTELFLETAEPEIVEFDDLQELLELLPEGEYEFSGMTAEGEELTGTAELTYIVPCEPEVVSPGEFEVVTPTNGVVIEWEAVEQEIDIAETVSDEVACMDSVDLEIDGYQVIVEEEESGIEFSITLPADDTSVTAPKEFFEANTLYKFEILAIEESGNQTITESFFCTGPALSEEECEALAP